MKTSLCIENERISAVCGTAFGSRVRVRVHAQERIAQGALINGIVTDERAFSDALSALLKKLPPRAMQDVRVMLRSSQIFVKRMPVPELPRRKLLEWTKNEFADAAAGESLLYDYMRLGSDPITGASVALLCAVQTTLVANLVTLLEAQGVSIRSIEPALSARIKLAGLLGHTRKATFILLALDGAGMDTLLFVDGMYHMSASVRLLAPRGTMDSVAEISRQVSSLIQFNTAQRSGHVITHVYLTGLMPEETQLVDQLKAAYDLSVGVLEDPEGVVRPPKDGQIALKDYADAVGGLIEWRGGRA